MTTTPRAASADTVGSPIAEARQFVISIVVKFDVRPECSGEWVDRMNDFTQATRDEPGNLWFE
jgi:hypothetical protein